MMNGLGPLDIDEVEAPKPAQRERDGRICVCGHAANNHGAVTSAYVNTPLEDIPRGSVACSAGRHQCECNQFYAVLVSGDNRRFMYKTTGPDKDHALTRGLMSALSGGVSIKWREGLTCGKCKTEGRLSPAAIRMTEDGAIIARSTTPFNYLLCASCRSELRVETDKDRLAVVSKPDTY